MKPGFFCIYVLLFSLLILVAGLSHDFAAQRGRLAELKTRIALINEQLDGLNANLNHLGIFGHFKYQPVKEE